MGYLLLWIENLAVSLLFVAWLTACVAHWQRKWLRGLGWMLPVGLLLLLYLLPTIAIGFSKFYQPPPPMRVPQVPGFYHLTALLICFILGLIVLRRKGFRRSDGETPALVAYSWPRAKIFAAWLVAVALQCMTFWNLDLEACQRLSALQTEMSALALSLEPATIPDSQNAAPIYERVADVLNSKDTTPANWDVWLNGLHDEPPMPDIKDPKVAEFFRQQSGVITLLHEAANKPGCVFERINKEYWPPVTEGMLSQIGEMRQLSRFLIYHAEWKAANGDMHSAMQDINASYALANHVIDEPLMVTRLMAIAIDGNTTSNLEKLLHLASPTVEDLDLIKIDHTVSYEKLMRKAYRRESLIGWSFLSQFAGKKMATMPIDEQKMFPPMALPFFSLYRVFMLESEMTAMRDIYNEISQVAAKPYYQVAKKWENKELEKSVRQKSVGTCSMVLSLLIPSIAASQQAAARGDAKHNTAVLALAISRYQLKNGSFPDKLSELVPDYLIVVPEDPLDGKPMKFKRTDKGVVIYSIGPDMIDDGGKPLDDKNKGDITFELFKRKP